MEARPERRKLALLDVAGTIVKGSVISEFAEHLHREGLFKEKALTEMRNIQKLYNAGHIDHNAATRQWSGWFSYGVKGQPVKKVEEQGKNFAIEILIKHRVSNLHMYIPLLRELGYDIHLLSGAPEEVIKPLAEFLKAGGVHALKLPKTSSGEKYSGNRPFHGYVMTAEEKEKKAKEIEKDYSGVKFMVGDGYIDIKALEKLANEGDAILFTGLREKPDEKAIEAANILGIRIERYFGDVIKSHLEKRNEEITGKLPMVKEPLEIDKLTAEALDIQDKLKTISALIIEDKMKDVLERIAYINSKRKTRKRIKELEELKDKLKGIEEEEAEITKKFKLEQKR